MKKVYPYIRVGTYEQARTTEEAELLRKAIEESNDFMEFYYSIISPINTERFNEVFEQRNKK